MTIHIVLVEPEIPQNTGNIARTCAVTGAHLHLVRPLGFDLDDRKLKRAGLDYWHYLPIFYYDSFAEVEERFPQGRFFCATTKGAHFYTDFHYQPDDIFVFGKETRGLPDAILQRYTDQLIRVPMLPERRSLNLATSVSIVAFEALRQLSFPGMV